MENMMYFQEPDQEGGGLDYAAVNHSSAVDSCTLCGGSAKRRSPSLSSPQQPHPKRIPLHPSSSPAAELDGFTKLPLPIAYPINSTEPASYPTPAMPTLRRCVSDFVNPLGPNNAGAVSGAFLNPLSPENAVVSGSATTPSPAKANSTASPVFLRSVSELCPAAYQADISPPEIIPGESPNSKRLKRMKDRMREMSKWCDEFIAEGEEGQEEGHMCGAEVVNNNAPKDDIDIEIEEAVSVERNGEFLIIQMKCPCGKGYQILLSGKNCYYKLL